MSGAIRRLWRPAGIVGLLLALLVFLLVGSSRLNLSLRREVQEQLQLLALRDAELTRDALLVRAGMLHDYDLLVDDRRELLNALAALRRAVASASDSARPLAPAVDELETVFRAKLDALERFKTNDALLRTSTAFLTFTISRMAIGPGTQQDMAQEVRQLSGTFLRFLQSPNDSSGAEFKAALEQLTVRGHGSEDLRSLVAHGALVAERLPQVVGMLDELAAAPTAPPIAAVWSAVERAADAAASRARLYRYGLFAVALLLLTYLVYQFAMLRRTAHDLRRANRELSHEVQVREMAQAALRSSEERYRAIAQSAHDAIISVDSAGMVVSWNPAAGTIFGHEAGEMIGQPIDRLLADGSALSGEPQPGVAIETMGRRKDGSEFPLEASFGRWSTAQGAFVTLIVRDVTLRKQLERKSREQERQLLQANKLAALGTLVSGVAHEINNPNQMVLLNSTMLTDIWRDACSALDACQEQDRHLTLAGLPYGEMREAATTLIRDVHEGARRIERIVQDLKDFARPQRSTLPVQLDLNEVVQQAVRLLRHTVERKCRRFELSLAPELPPVRGDAQQIEQVIVNLVVNALEALPDPSRRVTVLTRADRASGEVVLEVADEGGGIAPEHLSRLCDPFFTTKQDSGGTGLGLSVTFSLVQAHGGRLEFDSQPGRGTQVRVSLPAIAADR